MHITSLLPLTIQLLRWILVSRHVDRDPGGLVIIRKMKRLAMLLASMASVASVIREESCYGESQ
jgi:hypothetical protein